MLKSVWKDPVWSAVIAWVIIGVFGTAGTYFFGLWPAISNALTAGWRFLGSTTDVPNWALGILLLSCLPTVIRILMASLPSGTDSGLDWHHYTADNFFGLRWRWVYAGNEIVRLNTFCPHCDFQIFPYHAVKYRGLQGARIGFKCDSCHQELGEFEESTASLESKVERFIQQKLRNNTWSVSIEQKA
jgi:hypothetical protein